MKRCDKGPVERGSCGGWGDKNMRTVYVRYTWDRASKNPIIDIPDTCHFLLVYIFLILFFFFFFIKNVFSF